MKTGEKGLFPSPMPFQHEPQSMKLVSSFLKSGSFFHAVFRSSSFRVNRTFLNTVHSVHVGLSPAANSLPSALVDLIAICESIATFSAQSVHEKHRVFDEIWLSLFRPTGA